MPAPGPMDTIDQTFANLRTLLGAFRYFRHGWGRPHSINTSWFQRMRTGSLDASAQPMPIKKRLRRVLVPVTVKLYSIVLYVVWKKVVLISQVLPKNAAILYSIVLCVVSKKRSCIFCFAVAFWMPQENLSISRPAQYKSFWYEQMDRQYDVQLLRAWIFTQVMITVSYNFFEVNSARGFLCTTTGNVLLFVKEGQETMTEASGTFPIHCLLFTLLEVRKVGERVPSYRI